MLYSLYRISLFVIILCRCTSLLRIPCFVLSKVRNKASLVAACGVPRHIEVEHSQPDIATIIKNQIVIEGNSTATLKNLIKYGDNWLHEDRPKVADVTGTKVLSNTQFEKVIGCASQVEIRTSLIPFQSSNTAKKNVKKKLSTVRVDGKADSRVTQGMLAVLCKLFEGLTVPEALVLRPDTLTAYFGFDQLLPMGRQNTFYNMIKLIQTQLQRLEKNRHITTTIDNYMEDSSIENNNYNSGNCCTGIPSSESFKTQQVRKQSFLKPNNNELTQHSPITLSSEKHSNRQQNIQYHINTITPSHLHDHNTKFNISNTISSDQEESSNHPLDAPVQNDARTEEVAMLLSGGVDSSVALKLLLEQGYTVRAYYLKIWLEDEVAHLNSCPWEEDLQYATAVCKQLGVPLETISLQKEYWRDVVQYTLAEARIGRTPNPDVMCNSRVKFGTFYEYISRYHKKIASGHYAQVLPLREYLLSRNLTTTTAITHTHCTNSNTHSSQHSAKNNVNHSSDSVLQQDSHPSGIFNVLIHKLQLLLLPLQQYIKNSIYHTKIIKKKERISSSISVYKHDNNNNSEGEQVVLLHSQDPVKDQTYFLCNLKQEQLKLCIFPLGKYNKTQVRELAKEYNLPTQERKDSQGLCFLGKLKYSDFIQHYLGNQYGPIVCIQTGRIIGRHNGLWFYTIGQRKNLGLYLYSGIVNNGPYYVCAKDMHQNVLYISNDTHISDMKGENRFYVRQLNWINEISMLYSSSSGSSSSSSGSSSSTSTNNNTVATATITAVTTNNNYDHKAEVVVGDTIELRFKLRHSPEFIPGRLQLVGEGDRARIELAQDNVRIVPGQFVGFYMGEVCLGCGVVDDLSADIPSSHSGSVSQNDTIIAASIAASRSATTSSATTDGIQPVSNLHTKIDDISMYEKAL